MNSRLAAQRGAFRASSRTAFVAATSAAVALAAVLIALNYAGSQYADSPGPTNSVPFPVSSGTAMGSLDAPVTMVEYSDFQCRPCQQFTQTTQKEIETAYIETGKVRFIYKHRIVFGEDSVLAAMAAEAAAEQNKFWPYHELLMRTTLPKGKEPVLAELEALAAQIDLDMPLFKASLESGKYRDKVMKDDAEAQALDVDATPTFFINGTRVIGNVSFEDFRKAIETELERVGG